MALALALCEQDELASKAKALVSSEANFKRHPKSMEAAIVHGRVLYRLGRIEEADKVVRSVGTAGANISPESVVLRCLHRHGSRQEERSD